MFAGDLPTYLLLPVILTVLPLSGAHMSFHHIKIDKPTPIARTTVGHLYTHQVKKMRAFSSLPAVSFLPSPS